jgi:hypothetical protein
VQAVNRLVQTTWSRWEPDTRWEMAAPVKLKNAPA